MGGAQETCVKHGTTEEIVVLGCLGMKKYDGIIITCMNWSDVAQVEELSQPVQAMPTLPLNLETDSDSGTCSESVKSIIMLLM